MGLSKVLTYSILTGLLKILIADLRFMLFKSKPALSRTIRAIQVFLFLPLWPPWYA